eukprot:7378587-Prymnesium_polylepis.1
MAHSVCKRMPRRAEHNFGLAPARVDLGPGGSLRKGRGLEDVHDLERSVQGHHDSHWAPLAAGARAVARRQRKERRGRQLTTEPVDRVAHALPGGGDSRGNPHLRREAAHIGAPGGRSTVLLAAPPSSEGGARRLAAAEAAAAAVAQDQPRARAELERTERHLAAGAAHAAGAVAGEQVCVVDRVSRHDKRADFRRHAVLDGLHAHGTQNDERKPRSLLHLQARQLALR